MPLSKRKNSLISQVRAGVDADPWVIEEIRQMQIESEQQEELVRDLTLLVMHLIRRMRKYLEFDTVVDSALEFLKRKNLDESLVGTGDRDIICRGVRKPYGWTVAGSQKIFVGPYSEGKAYMEARKMGGDPRIIALYSDEES